MAKKVKLTAVTRQSLHFTLESGIKLGKKSHTVQGVKIELPSPQRTGTYGQQAAYASQAATKLIDKHFITN